MGVDAAVSADLLQPLTLPGIQPEPTRRILVAEAWDMTPHVETGLEIALRLAYSGFHVDYVHYGSFLPLVEFWRHSNIPVIAALLGYEQTPVQSCIKAAKDLAANCDLPLRIIDPSFIIAQGCPGFHLEPFASIQQLARATYQGSRSFGISLASSLVTLTRRSNPPCNRHWRLLMRIAKSFCLAHSLARQLLADRNYDGLIVFNGRFASVKGAVLAAEQCAVPVFFHERGSSKDTFSLSTYQPHDRERVQACMLRHWHQAAVHTREKVGAAYFLAKQQGRDTAWISFNQNPVQGPAKKTVEKARLASASGLVVAFFSSSEDEFISVADAYRSTRFEWSSQSEAFANLVLAARKAGHAVVMRSHPHLKSKHPRDRRHWDELTFLPDHRGVSIVPSRSRLDSYELLKAADVAVVYGSTIGIESVFSGTPTILMSDSFYDHIGATVYQPRSCSELHALMACADQLVAQPGSALIYGYYMASFGLPYAIYGAKDLFRGRFLGVRKTRRHQLLAWISARCRLIRA